MIHSELVVAALGIVAFALSALHLRFGFTAVANAWAFIGLALGTTLIVLLLLP